MVVGITYEAWVNRIVSRSDLTGRLTHLTRPAAGIDLSGKSFEEINLLAVENLIEILKAKQLNGSTKDAYIVGDSKAVCFQDAPLYAIVQNVEHEKFRRSQNLKEKLRYCGVGLSFVKSQMYREYGARSVIYEETQTAKDFLHKDEWWRIVDNEFKYNESTKEWDITDWTHEREWRVKGDLVFDFDRGHLHIVLYNPACVTKFLKDCPKEIISQIHGISTLKSILV